MALNSSRYWETGRVRLCSWCSRPFPSHFALTFLGSPALGNVSVFDPSQRVSKSIATVHGEFKWCAIVEGSLFGTSKNTMYTVRELRRWTWRPFDWVQKTDTHTQIHTVARRDNRERGETRESESTHSFTICLGISRRVCTASMRECDEIIKLIAICDEKLRNTVTNRLL